MRVTEHYKIDGSVPFVDVYVDSDSLLFINPTSIRNDLAAPLAARAHARLSSYTAELIRCRESPHSADASKGLGLLQGGLNEPNETRLGYTQNGSQGHGWGPGLGEYLWKQLDSPLCKEKLLTDLEHLPMFIPHVDRDLISDMTTRLVFPELIEFTLAIAMQHPQMLADMEKTDSTVWDPHNAEWAVRRDELPFVSGRHLLLVPKNWVSPRLLMAPRQYYNRFTTDAVQQERTRYINGMKDAPLKRQLREEFKDVRGFNSTQTLKNAEQGTNLVQLYSEFVDSGYSPLSDEEILHRTVKKAS